MTLRVAPQKTPMFPVGLTGSRLEIPGRVPRHDNPNLDPNLDRQVYGLRIGLRFLTLPYASLRIYLRIEHRKGPMFIGVLTHLRIKTPGRHPPAATPCPTRPASLPRLSSERRPKPAQTVRLVRPGTGAGTGATSKTPNVYRPWYGGTAPDLMESFS